MSSQYFRALDAGAQRALQLRLEAITECGNGNQVKSTQLYKQARHELKQAVAAGSQHARYLLITGYCAGGWGKAAAPFKCNDRFQKWTEDKSENYGMRWLCIQFCVMSTTPSPNEKQVACNRMLNGDFLMYEAIFSSTLEEIDTSYADMLVCVGSIIGVIAKIKQGPFNLKPYITGKSNVILLEYAFEKTANLVEVVHMLENGWTSIYKRDSRVLSFLMNCNGRLGMHRNSSENFKWAIDYLMGRIDPSVLDNTSRYNGEIAYYKSRTRAHRSRAITWMLVAGACGMHKDVSRIIGQMVYAERFVWD